MELVHRINALLARIDTNIAPAALLDQAAESFSTILHQIVERDVAIRQFEEILIIINQLQGNVEVNNLLIIFEGMIQLAVMFPVTMQASHQKGLVFQIAAFLLSQIPPETSNEWLTPTDQLVDAHPEQLANEITETVMDQINSFGALLGWQASRQLFTPIFCNLVRQEGDWRPIYAALIISFQLCEQIDQIEDVKLFIEWGCRYLNHIEPRIRWAALQLIGQLGDDFKPIFQDIYGEQIIPHVMKLLQDSHPRISSQAYCCLAYLCEKTTAEQNLQQYIPELLNNAAYHLKEGSPWMMESALTLLNALGETTEVLGNYALDILKICHTTIEDNKNRGDSYKVAVGQALEAACTTLRFQKSECLPQESFSYFVQQLQLLYQYIDQNYFLEIWNKLCQGYNNFTNLQTLYPYLLESFKQILFEVDCEKGETAVSYFSATFESFKSVLPTYAVQTEKMLKQIIFDSQIANCKVQAIKTLIKLTTALGQSNSQGYWLQNGKEIIGYLLKKIDEILEEDEISVDIPVYLESLNEVLSCFFPYFSQQQISNFALKIRHYFEKIFKLKINEDTTQNQPEEAVGQPHKLQGHASDNDEDYIDVDSDIDDEFLINENHNETLVNIAEQSAKLYGKILQLVNVEAKKQFAKFIVSEIGIILDHKLFLIVALDLVIILLEKCDYSLISDYWPLIFNILSENIANPKSNIRTSAVYGFGLFIKNTPIECIQLEHANMWIGSLGTALNTAYEESEQREDIKFTKDNVISAIGKLINHCSAIYPDLMGSLYNGWLTALPLNHDMSEGNEQQAILLDIIERTPSIYQNNEMVLNRICQIFAGFASLRKDAEYASIIERTKNVMKTMASCPLFTESSDRLWEGLNKSQRNSLIRLLN